MFMEAFSPKHCLWKTTGKGNETKTAVGSFSGQCSAAPAPPFSSAYLLKLPFSTFMYVHVLHFKWCRSWFSCTESCGLLIAGLFLMGFTWILALPREAEVHVCGCSRCPGLGRAVQGGCPRPGAECPAGLPDVLRDCDLHQVSVEDWLSQAAGTFLRFSHESISGTAVGACMVLLFAGEQQYVKAP